MAPALTTPSELRAIEGIDPSATDAQLLAAIRLSTQYIERITGQRFSPVVFTDDKPLLVDGSGMEKLRLPLPPMAVTKVMELGFSVDLAGLDIPTDADPWKDDRRDPMLVKRPYFAAFFMGNDGSFGSYGYYGGYPRVPKWARIRNAIAISGLFGYVEPDNAWLDFAQFTPHVDSQVQAAAAGYAGSLLTIALAPDGVAKAVTVTSDLSAPLGGTAYVFHFQPNVSTVADLEAAIAGVTDLAVKASGTQATVLTVVDKLAPTALCNSAPEMIRKICRRMVFRYWRPIGDPQEKEDRRIAQPQSESVDGHSASLTGLVVTCGLTGDPEIDDNLAYYRLKYGGGSSASYGG